MASRHRRIESTPDRLFPFEEMAARGPRPDIYAIFGRAEFSSNGALPYSATHRAYRKLSAFGRPDAQGYRAPSLAYSDDRKRYRRRPAQSRLIYAQTITSEA